MHKKYFMCHVLTEINATEEYQDRKGYPASWF